MLRDQFAHHQLSLDVQARLAYCSRSPCLPSRLPLARVPFQSLSTVRTWDKACGERRDNENLGRLHLDESWTTPAPARNQRPWTAEGAFAGRSTSTDTASNSLNFPMTDKMEGGRLEQDPKLYTFYNTYRSATKPASAPNMAKTWVAKAPPSLRRLRVDADALN